MYITHLGVFMCNSLRP